MKVKALLFVFLAVLICAIPARAEWGAVAVAAQADIGINKISMARDSNDTPYIAYRDVNDTTLKYADNSGWIWKTTIIDDSANVGTDTSIAVDSNNKGHISYRAVTSPENLKYATNASGDLADLYHCLG